MKFDFVQFGSLYNYLSENNQIFLDAVLLTYTLYTAIVYFNIGLTSTILRLAGYVGAFFIAKNLTTKVAGYIGISEPMSILLLGLFIFFLFAYFIYKQIQFFFYGARSLADSLMGGIYGFFEIIFFIGLINICARYAHQNNFPIPDWMLEANQIKPKDPNRRNSITYFVFEFVSKYTKTIVDTDQVNKLVDWFKEQVGAQEIQVKPEILQPSKETKAT